MRIEVGAPRPRERDALFAWLDGELRGGRLGRLRAESPHGVAHPSALHAVARSAGRPVSHALGRVVRARAAGGAAPVGVIGLVYTEPAFRGRGLARTCVQSMMDRLAAGGALAIALWSEHERFYEPLGFHRAGSEWIWAIDAATCRAARGGGGRDLEVALARTDDFAVLEALQAEKASRIDREPGALARAAAAPECETRVARRGDRAVAYASAGRGDDLRGVVHEWAGDADGVLACVEALCREAGATRLLSASDDDEPLARLRALGVACERRPLAWLHVPDAARLWSAVTANDPALATVDFARSGDGWRLAGRRGSVDLSHDEALALLLGPERPARAATALAPDEFLALRARLPWPLFFWGFDSL